MILGGIYDQLGGGFARYSTDNQWLIPHFEKMLYDNALLVIVLCEAYQVTESGLYADAVRQTLAFVENELSNGEGGYFSALDADSEGEEGKYYVWDKAEIESLLGEDAGLFCAFYGVTEKGNWEGRNILVRKDAAEPEKMGPEIADGERLESSERLISARLRLLEHRSRRTRPALDDKVLLSWNGLMTIALVRAYGALGDQEYKERAIANIAFCRKRMKGDGSESGLYTYYHSYKGGLTGGAGERGFRINAFLDDYAYLIAALLQVQEITGDTDYLLEAKELLEFVLDHFGDEAGVFFYFTHEDQADVILRKREVYDGATPSGNSMMAWNLSYMAIIFDKQAWSARAARMVEGVSRALIRYPSSFGMWATLFQALTYTIQEIVITGRRLENARQELLRQFIPNRIIQSSEAENTQFPLLIHKQIGDDPLLYLCKNYSCQLPVNEVTALLRLLENVQKFNPI
jgi:uncharacterized protein YyaL (SSP411 family)